MEQFAESLQTLFSFRREAFVFAVRLALDRVRELMRSGQLKIAKPSADNADELLDVLKRAEGGSLDLALDSGKLTHTRLADVQPETAMSQAVAQVIDENATPLAAPANGDSQIPATPDARVASGFVWPPVDGRLVLHELANLEVRLARNPRGDWCGVAGDRWRLLSPADAVFQDVEQGRAVLVNAARAQAARAQGRVMDRCVVLAADGAGRHRLWTIARLDAEAVSLSPTDSLAASQ